MKREVDFVLKYGRRLTSCIRRYSVCGMYVIQGRKFWHVFALALNPFILFQKFGVPVVTSETGQEYVSDSAFCTYFILSDFENPVFEELDKAGVR